MTPKNPRGRVLNVAGTLKAESRRLSMPNAQPTPGALLESLASELEDVALAMLGMELDGPAADGPAEVEALDAEFDSADTVPIGLVASIRKTTKAEA